ncbi:FtsX-like permease family protein [Mucilaginibacter limnophilus]|uniref:FtsX-like permease family protein n=2 Tax=Mucilaginibacter limnophilus TaxID=1932778 RepID=A0A3S2X1B7_9SPHI|nr:FtsX-like permease family protein [Mucilaginibacter limnophilus]
MIRNYIKSAYRSLKKNTGFTAINIMGLALGLAACLLIVFYVIDELSYDRYNEKAGRIYRVNEDLKLGENKLQYAVCMAPLAQTLKNDFPEVENAVRLKKAGSIHIKKGTEKIREDYIGFADPSVFDVFTLPVLFGDVKTALVEPNSIVLTESMAKKYFGKTDVVGESLLFDDRETMKVTGVIKDIPQQSHFRFDFLVSMSSLADSRSPEWLRSEYNTYVLFRKGADPKKLEAAFPQLLRKYSGGQMQSELKKSYDEFEKGGSYFRLNLIPLTDIHLHSKMIGELSAAGTVEYIYILSGIALFILIIACINFMNLSTARSSNRAREVGVRKVLGSARKNLIAQFLTESILVTFAATLIAMAIVVLVLPGFNVLAGKELSISLQSLKWIVPMLLMVALVVGALAGSYPAFFLSAFQPVSVLKGSLSAGFKSSRLRSFLVVFQFSISIFLIIGTLVVYQQLNYIQTKNLGYNRNQVLVINNSFEIGNGDKVKLLKQQIAALPGIENATMSGYLPTSQWRNMGIYYKDAVPDQSRAIFPQVWRVDADYIKTLGMQLVQGRNFSKDMPTDTASLIINEAAAKFLGFKNPVNQTLYHSKDYQTHGEVSPYKIIGVVKDFHFNSMRETIAPMMMVLGEDWGRVSARVSTANINNTLDQVKKVWSGISPDIKIDYSFMDAEFDAIYRSEQQIGQIFIVFTSLAIIIACLGLFGLAAYAAEQRTKEIGIRKVLGASVSTIVNLLSKDFLKLVLLAILISSPIAWYSMHRWLQNYAYRINIGWWVFAAAGIAGIVVALLTISFQSIKAALANPVKSLRSE